MLLILTEIRVYPIKKNKFEEIIFLMPKRPGRKSAAQTPAPRSERKYGSKKNKPGSASAQSEAKITLSDEIVKGLEKKAEDFNEKHPRKKVRVGTLKKVFRRGAGAYSKSHRPFISGNRPNSRSAWSYARVNKFLKKKAGQKVKAAYVQDDDLLAKGGQVYNDKELLAKYKKGDSIGFTAIAHLKAKGLIPRADGTKRKSEKYLENGGMIAPNGKPSNLTPEQYELVRTPEFKAWFGDWENDPKNASKIVDENGEPLVCYHGTDTNFTVFDKRYVGSSSGEYFDGNGFYFTSDYINAKSYADYYSNTSGGITTPIVYSCFLNLKNPLIKNTVFQAHDILDDVLYARNHGYDGYIVLSIKEQGEYTKQDGANQIVAFEPEQIKLADGSNTTFYGSNPDIRYDEGGVVFVRNKSYDNSATIRRLPYRGVSAFAVHTDDFEKFKHYAEKEEGVDTSNWEVYNLDDFDNYELCAMPMSETNDYVMGYSDDKPTLKKFDAEEHTMYIDEDGLLDYDDAHEIIILPKKMNQGGMTALFVNSLMDSAKDIDYVIEYAIENDINPKEMSFSEFNEKINPDGKYSTFEIRLAQRELNKYFKSGGDIKQSNMEITCKQCGWQWNTASSKPEDATMCHKCGYNNVSEDIIQMNSPTYLRSLEFAREDAKEDVDLHKVTENAVALSKAHPIRMDDYDELVQLENGGQTNGQYAFAYEPKEYVVQDFICMEQDLVDSLLESDMTKIGKIRICQAKIDLAENKLKQTESEQEYEAWYLSSCIWRDCMNSLRANFKAGGRISGCGCKEYKDGGLAYGNSHAKGGMPMTVKNTGQNIEIEGGEGVVNKRSMQMKKEVEFQGKKMTPCEVISSINEMGGGVKFKCEDVKKIIEKDGEYD